MSDAEACARAGRNLVPNAVIVWNTVYMAEAVAQLKREVYPVNESALPYMR